MQTEIYQVQDLNANPAVADTTSSQRGVVLSMMFLVFLLIAPNTVKSQNAYFANSFMPQEIVIEMLADFKAILDTMVVESAAPRPDGMFYTCTEYEDGIWIFRIHCPTGAVLFTEWQFLLCGTRVPVPHGSEPPPNWLICPKGGTTICIWTEIGRLRDLNPHLTTMEALAEIIPVEDVKDTVITITSSCLQYIVDFPVKLYYTDVSNTFDLRDLFTTVVVSPNPSGIHTDINVSVNMMKPGSQKPIPIPDVYGRLNIYHLQGTDVVLVGSIPVKVGDTHTINNALLSSPGTYNIVGEFSYKGFSFETNALIMRIP